MDTESIFYHFGWILGVVWLILGIGQVYIGLQGQATTNFSDWETYTWLGRPVRNRCRMANLVVLFILATATRHQCSLNALNSSIRGAYLTSNFLDSKGV